MQNLNNFNKIRGIMKIVCYYLFNTVLNKQFNITDVYIYSPQDKIITEFIKNDPVQKFTYPWKLNNLCCLDPINWIFLCKRQKQVQSSFFNLLSSSFKFTCMGFAKKLLFDLETVSCASSSRPTHSTDKRCLCESLLGKTQTLSCQQPL